MRKLSLHGLLIAIALSACSGAPSVEQSPTSSVTEASATEAPGATATPSSDAVQETPSAASKLGLPAIELLTISEGGGTRPVLEWTAVDGADFYIVSVHTPEGVGYWAWRTEETSVPVGGLPRLNEGAMGPSIAPGMTWSVLALDSEGNLLAASNERPISP